MGEESAKGQDRGRGLRRDFPGGPVVKNLPSNGGDVDLISGLRTRISYATEKLSSTCGNYRAASYNERSRVLHEILVVPREKTPTGAAARGNP